MRSGTVFLLVLFLFGGYCAARLDAQSPGEAGERAGTPEARLEALFHRYNRQRIGMKEVFSRLKSWEDSELRAAAGKLLSTDYETLKNMLSREHLRAEVRPDLRTTLRDKRERLLKIIRNRDRYNDNPRNRSLRKKVESAAVGLFTLFRKPLVYHIQTGASNSDAFFRSVALIQFFRSADRPVPDPGRKLLKRIASAKEIISTSSVGRAVELQPHSRENKNIEEANETSDVELNKPERELVRLVNTYREAFGLRTLLLHKKVTAAAEKQSRRMNEMGKLTHLSGDASENPLLNRLEEIGFAVREAGENVARGDDPPIAVLKGWIQSPAHHRNMLKDNYRYIGVAKDGKFWTLDMTTVPRVQDQGGF